MKLKANRHFILFRRYPSQAVVRPSGKRNIGERKADTINQAVDLVGISQSAFYKYQDGIFLLSRAEEELSLSA